MRWTKRSYAMPSKKTDIIDSENLQWYDLMSHAQDSETHPSLVLMDWKNSE